MNDVPSLVGMPGRVVAVRFRGRRCTALAELRSQEAGCGAPITDVVSLELISGSGDQPNWTGHARVHALIETGHDALRTVHRASRWASYAARVAVVPGDRVTEQACLEASLRGVWLIAADEGPRVAVAGQRGAVAGAARGPLHRLLDELVAAQLMNDGRRATCGSRTDARSEPS